MLIKVSDIVQLVIVWNLMWNILARGLQHLMDKEYPNHLFYFILLFFYELSNIILIKKTLCSQKS